jgi:hypothetical protein
MRHSLSITLRCSVILGVASALIWLSVASPFREQANAALLTPTPMNYRDALMRAGLGPEQLTAAVLSDEDIQDALGDVWTHLIANEGALENADAALAAAEAEYWPLERLVRTAQATQQEHTDFQTAESTYQSARNNRDAVLDDIFNAGITNLTVTQQQKLTNTRRSTDWRLPWEFHVVERSEPAWVDLRSALAAERYASKHEQQVEDEAAAILTGERGNIDVALAATNLATNLATNTAAWNQVVDGE